MMIKVCKRTIYSVVMLKYVINTLYVIKIKILLWNTKSIKENLDFNQRRSLALFLHRPRLQYNVPVYTVVII